MNLADGEVRFGNQQVTNVTLNLTGTVNGPLEMANSRLNVSFGQGGGLHVTSRLDAQGGEIHLQGSTLSISGNMTADDASWIYFESGSINTGLPAFISGHKVGPGYLNGNPIP